MTLNVRDTALPAAGKRDPRLRVDTPGRTSGLRRRLRATREGKVFVFVTIGLGFAAVNTGTNLMYLVFGFMLSLIISSGVLSEHALRRMRVARSLPGRVVAGEPALIELELSNAKPRFTSYSLELAEGHDASARCYFLKVLAGQTERASYRLLFPRRGPAELSAIRISTRFPFALFEKWCLIPLKDELVVYPRPRKVRLPRGLFREEGEGSGSVRGRGVETHELRDYRAGDEARSVHWRRTAALGRPIVREFSREAASSITLYLDNHVPPGDEAASQRFERDVERAAFLVALVHARGEALEICARGSASGLLAVGGSEAPLLTFLALLAPVTEAAPFAAARTGASVVYVGQLVDAEAPAPGQGTGA